MQLLLFRTSRHLPPAPDSFERASPAHLNFVSAYTDAVFINFFVDIVDSLIIL